MMTVHKRRKKMMCSKEKEDIVSVEPQPKEAMALGTQWCKNDREKRKKRRVTKEFENLFYLVEKNTG